MWEHVLLAASWPRSGALLTGNEGSIAGFAHVCPTRDEDGDPLAVGEITAIYLLPAVWSTGVGRTLMRACVDLLAIAGYRQATLWALDTNLRARRFYEAGGWRPDDAVRREVVLGVGVTELRYRRPVS
jgi:GNAT superfamily N-acetyltransferase